jgi:hypothetical protein
VPRTSTLQKGNDGPAPGIGAFVSRSCVHYQPPARRRPNRGGITLTDAEEK